MERNLVLHFFTPSKNASPFDANMAYDAGYDAVIPYTGVALDEVRGLVQDTIFSRGARGVWRTGIFIGGRSVNLAMDMLEVAKKSMFSPFIVSVFADPSGAFTTSASVVATVEAALARNNFNDTLQGKKVKVFGATGPVGLCAAVLAAQNGAEVHLVGHQGLTKVEEKSACYGKRYGVILNCADGSNEDKQREILHDADVVLCCAAAGVRVLSADVLRDAKSLKVIVDINAVPPSGVEGVGVMDDGVAVANSNAIGFGALAIGNNKYNVQQALFKSMIDGQMHVFHDFMTALEVARTIVL